MQEIKKVKVGKIKPNPSNPRLIRDDKFQLLVKSIKEFPEMLELRPIVVNADMIILGGNMRYKACVEAGLKEIPVIISKGLTPEQEREFIIKDNASFGDWDLQLIQQEWGDVNLPEWGIDLQIEEPNHLDAKEDEYEVPLGGTETDIVEGDIFDIGQHRLLCGSSTQTDTWERLMGQELADLVITDPPYNVAYVGKTKDALKIANDKQTDGNFYQFLYDFYTALGSFTKGGGHGMFGTLIAKVLISAGQWQMQGLW